jgi:hypothetical protein
MTEEIKEVSAEEAAIQEKIQEAFTASTEANKSEDDVKMAMIQAGASFKNVARLYNAMMIDAGLAISKEDRDAIVKECIQKHDVSHEDGFDIAVDFLVEKLTDSTIRSAAALIRGFCRKNEMPYFVPEKETGNGTTGFTKRYLQWVVDVVKETGRIPDIEVAKNYIHGKEGFPETSNNTKRNETHFLNYIYFAGKILNQEPVEAKLNLKVAS